MKGLAVYCFSELGSNQEEAEHETVVEENARVETPVEIVKEKTLAERNYYIIGMHCNV